jgi:cobalamin biosynthesis Mg chelatase CobN
MNSNMHRDQPQRGDGPVVQTTRARQGVTGHNARYVLLVGTVAVVLLFGIVYIAYFS